MKSKVSQPFIIEMSKYGIQMYERVDPFEVNMYPSVEIIYGMYCVRCFEINYN